MVDYQTLVGDHRQRARREKVAPRRRKWLEYGSLDAGASRQDQGRPARTCARRWTGCPRAPQLVTIKTDCDLAAVEGLPGSTPSPWSPTRPGLATSTSNTASRAWRARFRPAAARTRAGRRSRERRPPFADHSASPVAEAAQHRTVVYDTVPLARLRPLAAAPRKAELVALDTETTSLDDARRNRRHQLQRSPARPPTFRWPTPGRMPPRNCRATRCWRASSPGWKTASSKLGQHVKYDRHVFANHGIEVQGYVHDTMLQSYVLEVHKPHNLTSLAERHTGRSGISYEDLCGKGAHQIPFAQVPVDKAAAYARTRPDAGRALALWPRLQADELRFIYELEMPAARRSTASSATAC
jgi:DNA polymerase-1